MHLIIFSACALILHQNHIHTHTYKASLHESNRSQANKITCTLTFQQKFTNETQRKKKYSVEKKNRKNKSPALNVERNKAKRNNFKSKFNHVYVCIDGVTETK